MLKFIMKVFKHFKITTDLTPKNPETAAGPPQEQPPDGPQVQPQPPVTAETPAQAPPKNTTDTDNSTRIITPTVLRRILPLVAFSVAFAIVMTVLILYMDNTAMRHYQFQVNMSQDYELLSVSQDNPKLVAYIREFHLEPAIEPHHKPIESEITGPPEDVAYVLKLLNGKKQGFFVESGAYSDGKSSKTEWLERPPLNWSGLLIQADTRHFFSLKRHNRAKSQAIHACLSSMPYPKEVTFHHQENSELRITAIHHNHNQNSNDIDNNSTEDKNNELHNSQNPELNSMVADGPEWFATRIKCFPLFSLLLAMNHTQVDFLSLESFGTELQVLETVPFERVQIDVIGVHLLTSDLEADTVKKFLAAKNYKYMESFFGNKTHVFMLNRIKI